MPRTQRGAGERHRHRDFKASAITFILRFCRALEVFHGLSELRIVPIFTDASAALAVLQGLGLGGFERMRLGNVAVWGLLLQSVMGERCFAPTVACTLVGNI